MFEAGRESVGRDQLGYLGSSTVKRKLMASES